MNVALQQLQDAVRHATRTQALSGHGTCAQGSGPSVSAPNVADTPLAAIPACTVPMVLQGVLTTWGTRERAHLHEPAGHPRGDVQMRSGTHQRVEGRPVGRRPAAAASAVSRSLVDVVLAAKPRLFEHGGVAIFLFRVRA